ncbi:MAG: hypothetical protein A2901_00815 [Elusimicrobia bacterium RIFCSPLOWO2_01_FULL_54_10]|nr:MAG: hypothetical protein A2901_00815 [Elusimicrobia bacterium RIFCSPLOWO2_01_FULL_54_10]
MKKVLLTSVCRPIGPDVGDAPSVGYELLYRQVTRAQGIFSPRSLHLNFSLEYIAENLSAPTTVLQYPSKKELIRELKKGYDFIGITFLMAIFHHLKESVELIRRYSPKCKIILGGYGTILSDEVLKPYADYICREEGVGFFRKLLGEPEGEMPYSHPLIVSRMKIFSLPVSKTGMIFAGLGCPNGCDFCCTSHFFKRKHIRLLPTGQDIYDVIERYLDLDPDMQFVVLDEDFLLNRKRAMELRDAVLKGSRPVSLFVFSSIRAISQYTVEEILEMGIDGFWIGYEGSMSGYAKQQGRPAAEILTEFRENGIIVLASMVIGFDYQNEQIIREELDGLLRLKPTLTQILIYGPVPGTPFYDRIMQENRLREDLVKTPEKYYRIADGFSAMVRHPNMPAEEIERLQRRCFKEDFERQGPSIYRALETWFLGYLKHRHSTRPFLKKKAERFAHEVRKAYPIFLPGKILIPGSKVRGWLKELEHKMHRELGIPSIRERVLSLLAFAFALWTKFKVGFNLLQHPSLVRHVYRDPKLGLLSRHWWEALRKDGSRAALSVKVEWNRHRNMIRVRLDGVMDSWNTEELCTRIIHSLRQRKEKLVLDFEKLKSFEGRSVRIFCDRLKKHRSRILIVPADAPGIVHSDWVLLCQEFSICPVSKESDIVNT